MVRLIGRKMNESTVSIDARNWAYAAAAMLQCHEFQPDGYTLIAAKIVRRGKKGGQRCQLHLVLRHTNLGYPEITQAEVGDLFFSEASIAAPVREVREDLD
jgi:hypothetical protein